MYIYIFIYTHKYMPICISAECIYMYIQIYIYMYIWVYITSIYLHIPTEGISLPLSGTSCWERSRQELCSSSVKKLQGGAMRQDSGIQYWGIVQYGCITVAYMMLRIIRVGVQIAVSVPFVDFRHFWEQLIRQATTRLSRS